MKNKDLVDKIYQLSEELKDYFPKEYITDTDRLNWLEKEIINNGTITFNRHGQSYIKSFSASSQHIKQMPNIREAIDKMMEEDNANQKHTQSNTR